MWVCKVNMPVGNPPNKLDTYIMDTKDILVKEQS